MLRVTLRIALRILSVEEKKREREIARGLTDKEDKSSRQHKVRKQRLELYVC